jgi:PadR family transcriptional regulator, regulatory protein AphA
MISAGLSKSYGMLWIMSIDATALEPPARLTATSHLVLGLIEREGPSTPYDLKRHVAATIGHFWSFPHALLYKEPARLADLGLLSEEREAEGRRRRLFSITPAGSAALRAWLAEPARESTELRDAGLLQLFFADLSSAHHRLALARAQLGVHRAALAAYESDRQDEHGTGQTATRPRTVERWRGVTLPMGLLYERAAIAFWEQVAADAEVETTGTDPERADATNAPAGSAAPAAASG